MCLDVFRQELDAFVSILVSELQVVDLPAAGAEEDIFCLLFMAKGCGCLSSWVLLIFIHILFIVSSCFFLFLLVSFFV